jgi:hypothetical protein
MDKLPVLTPEESSQDADGIDDWGIVATLPRPVRVFSP